MSTAENARGLDRPNLDSGAAIPEPANATPLGESFWDRKTTLADLIARQGRKPIAHIDDLRADFWPEDESADDIVDAIRRWRREGE